jgi:hypothetical protein
MGEFWEPSFSGLIRDLLIPCIVLVARGDNENGSYALGL